MFLQLKKILAVKLYQNLRMDCSPMPVSPDSIVLRVLFSSLRNQEHFCQVGQFFLYISDVFFLFLLKYLYQALKVQKNRHHFSFFHKFFPVHPAVFFSHQNIFFLVLLFYPDLFLCQSEADIFHRHIYRLLFLRYYTNPPVLATHHLYHYLFLDHIHSQQKFHTGHPDHHCQES